MRKKFIFPNILFVGVLCLTVVALLCPKSIAQDAAPAVAKPAITELDKALQSAKEGSSEARQRLAVRRVIRDAEEQLEANANSPDRFLFLEFIFRAQQQLMALDDDSKHREAFLATCRELIKAPDEFAELRLEADLLLSQADLAKQGASSEERAEALRPFVDRYLSTPVAAKVLRLAMVMALELGDNRLVTDLRELIEERFAGDLEMIAFQRDKLGGQVFGAPFIGSFKCSDGSVMQLPADALGKTTVLYFWSQEDPADDHTERLAAEWKIQKDEVGDRLNILSFNVDQLPDAGEKILRDLGVEWPALHLPGGRENPLYKTFPQRDPYMMTMTPTGYVALIMSGSSRKRVTDTGKTDFTRWFQSALARDWSRERYSTQLSSLFAGDFFVVDPEGPFDPTLPPEIKALSEKPTPLKRTAASVPEETLRAIQDCFPKPPLRYRMPAAEIGSGYRRAEELCAKAIAAHPDAPDLWIVRNRRIVAQLGLWKLTSDRTHYQRAVEEAKAAIDSGMPPGTEVIASFCLAKESMRDPEAEPKKVITDFVKAMGGESAPGPALAAASLLALDISNRGLHDEYRDLILERHVDHPMMWTFNSFLLDRYHRYWLFREPFVAGWSYGRRQQYFLSQGYPDEVQRSIQAELQTLDGEPYRLPEDCSGKWTIVLFTNSWVDQERPQLPGTAGRIISHNDKRGLDDVQVIVAVIDGEVAPIQAYLKEKPLKCETMMLPGGVANPLVQQLGILEEDEVPNALVLRPDGSIATAVSGLTMSRTKGQLIPNIIDWHDEQSVKTLLENGDIEKAKEFIFKLAPPYDPEAVDEKGRALKKPVFSNSHVRARARVYRALKDWDAALADIEEVVQRETATAGGMSLRTDALDEAEELRDTIREKQGTAKP